MGAVSNGGALSIGQRRAPAVTIADDPDSPAWRGTVVSYDMRNPLAGSMCPRARQCSTKHLHTACGRAQARWCADRKCTHSMLPSAQKSGTAYHEQAYASIIALRLDAIREHVEIIKVRAVVLRMWQKADASIHRLKRHLCAASM